MELTNKEEEIFEQRSIRTVALRKDEWLENVKKNAPYVKKDISVLWNDDGGGEGISVAAGPSLINDLKELKELRKGKELIVVDAVFKTCI